MVQSHRNPIWVFDIVDTSIRYARLDGIVERRDTDTLRPNILAVVQPGSVVHSDEWTAYNAIFRAEVSHMTLNHSVNFLEPWTGLLNQIVESY